MKAKRETPATEGVVLSWSDAAKIGSALVHADEALDPGGHPFDVQTFAALMKDPAVVAFLDVLRRMALLPVKR